MIPSFRYSAGLLILACATALRWDAGAATAKTCEAALSREFDFTGPNARDTLEVSARGMDCTRSVVTVSIRKADGLPVMAFAMPLMWLHETIDTANPMSEDTLKGLLQAYVTDAQLDTKGTSIPLWKKRDPTPGFSQGLELTTPLDRRSYARLRATRPNLLCMADVRDMGVCYAWDARDARAVLMLRR